MTQKSEASPTLYLDDLGVGQRFTSGTYHMDADRMKSFAAGFDPQPFHLDEAAAERSIFRGLAASGWHTPAAPWSLMVDTPPVPGCWAGVVGAKGPAAPPPSPC